ncbi:MAG: hypothetical protein IPG55_16885 [Saprospiraceae bacterium]|nr:hypothetical protein [Candidatus Defluviibacterium haderslevense]
MNKIILKYNLTNKDTLPVNGSLDTNLFSFKAENSGKMEFKVFIFGRISGNLGDSCSAKFELDIIDLPKITLRQDNYCINNNDAQVNIGLSIEDQYLKNPFPFKLTYLNNTFGVDTTPEIKVDLFKNDLSEEVIFNVKVENDSTTCMAELFDNAYVYRIPKFDFKDSTIISCTNTSKLIVPHHYAKGSVLFEWKENVDTLPYKTESPIIIGSVINGEISYKYQITNQESKIIPCVETGKFVIDGKQRPEIDALTELLNCSGLIKLNLKDGKISNLNGVNWSSINSNTELIPISKDKDIVLVKSKSAPEKIRCIINIGSCADTMSVNLSNFPVVDTSNNLIKSIICKDKDSTFALYQSFKMLFMVFY